MLEWKIKSRLLIVSCSNQLTKHIFPMKILFKRENTGPLYEKQSRTKILAQVHKQVMESQRKNGVVKSTRLPEHHVLFQTNPSQCSAAFLVTTNSSDALKEAVLFMRQTCVLQGGSCTCHRKHRRLNQPCTVQT